MLDGPPIYARERARFSEEGAPVLDRILSQGFRPGLYYFARGAGCTKRLPTDTISLNVRLARTGPENCSHFVRCAGWRKVDGQSGSNYRVNQPLARTVSTA
jgi:hypothetical protein